MGLSIHYQLAHFESFSHGRKGCGVTSAFFPKLFYLLTQPAVLYSRAILSYPRLRNCNFSYVFFTSISLWLITRHKLTQKCLPSIFFCTENRKKRLLYLPVSQSSPNKGPCICYQVYKADWLSQTLWLWKVIMFQIHRQIILYYFYTS